MVVIQPADTVKQISFDLADGNYTWYVRAYDRAGTFTSSNTNSIIVKVPIPPAAPQLTYPPNNTSLGDDLTPDLAWNTVENANYFYVQLSDVSSFINIISENNQVLTLNWTPSLTKYGKYYWRVKAHSTNGIWGDWSETRNFTIELLSPALLLPVNNSTDQSLSIDFKWSKSSSPSKFVFKLSDNSNFTTCVKSDSNLVDTTYQVSALNEAQKYYWKVRAENDAGYSYYTDIWNFTTLLFAPTNLTANNKDIKKVELKWQDNSSFKTGYVIERKQGDSLSTESFSEIFTTSNNITTYIDSTVSDSSYYTFRIKAIKNTISSEYSNTTTIKTLTPTSVNDILLTPTEYSLNQNYPNPFNPITTIKYALPFESNIKLIIYSTLGEKINELVNSVKSAGFYEEVFNAGNLSSGLYFYSLHAKPLNGSKEFREVKKLLLLK